MEINRRDVCVAMGAFAFLGGLVANAQEPPSTAGSSTESDDAMKVSKVFRFDQLQASPHANGGWGRAVMHGTLPTGEFVEVHETMLPPGEVPHPPHHHRNTEFVLVRQGTLEFMNAGKAEQVGVGDVIYTASDQMHGLKNIGVTPALYFIVSISHGQM